MLKDARENSGLYFQQSYSGKKETGNKQKQVQPWLPEKLGWRDWVCLVSDEYRN